MPGMVSRRSLQVPGGLRMRFSAPQDNANETRPAFRSRGRLVSALVWSTFTPAARWWVRRRRDGGAPHFIPTATEES